MKPSLSSEQPDFVGDRGGLTGSVLSFGSNNFLHDRFEAGDRHTGNPSHESRFVRGKGLFQSVKRLFLVAHPISSVPYLFAIFLRATADPVTN